MYRPTGCRSFGFGAGGKGFRSTRNINLLPSKTKETYFGHLELHGQGTGVRKPQIKAKIHPKRKGDIEPLTA